MADNGSEPISADELKRLGKALKDDKFRQLLIEYADEIRDPENRKRYEQELSILERERGVDLTFVHPEAGFVIKTSTTDGTKTFVNMCKNKNVGKPSCSRSKTKPGLDWSIPYFLSPPRDDVDKSSRKCRLFDVVFHPDTIYMAQRNARFYKMIEDTAIEGIRQKFCVSLDRKNVFYPKLKYKGHPFPTVLRKPTADAAVTELSEKLENANLDADDCALEGKFDNRLPSVEETNWKNNGSVEPKYTIRYRNNVNMEDFTYLSQQNANLRPDEIVIDIQLPFSDSAKGVDLDVIGQTLILKSTDTVNYKLELPLPFPVYDDQGKAQFHQKERILTVTLPVRPFESSTKTDAEEDLPNDRQSEGPVQQTSAAEIIMNNSPCTDALCNISLHADELLKQTCVSLKDPEEVFEQFQGCNCCMMGHLCLPSHAYDLPNFEVNQSEEELTLLLKVPKIHEESVEMQLCECGLGLQIVFTSTADTNWYSFCMVSDNHIQLKELHSDVSDLNMTLQLSKSQSKEWISFSYGCYEAVGDIYYLINSSSILNKFEKLKDDTEKYLNGALPIESEHIQVKEVTEESLKLQIGVLNPPRSSCEADTEEDPYDNGIEVLRKSRSSSESSQDLCPLPTRRGILKYPRNWRSISESSDDFNSWSSLDMLTPSPEDEDSVYTDKIPKKNVRFSDHVDKNIFRANSSILGQKKKNQKRAECKKRAAHRTSSQEEESESHDSTATTEEETENLSNKGRQQGKPKKKKKTQGKASTNQRGHNNNNTEKKTVESDVILDSLMAGNSKETCGDEESTSDTPAEETPKKEEIVPGTLGETEGIAAAESQERTNCESFSGLDFRTNNESVIHLSLPPENSAFHLD